VDNEWVRHFKIQSRKLSAFWGRPVFIHATALLPRDYGRETNRRYATVYTLGHNVPFNFSTDSARVRGRGTINPVTGVETGYDFYLAWSSDSFPRMVAISFEQQTPYFPDGYSVNSANNGPYGDAVVEEVIPYLEKELRLVSSPHARLVEGASTGGWSALNLQLRHPDFFGGAWVLQPDPIDFRRYQLLNIYEDVNAFTQPLGAFNVAERPFRRSVEGQVVWTARQLSRFEEVLGTRGRSGFQLEAWGSELRPGRQRRISQAALGQAHRSDRQGRRHVHEGEWLRPAGVRRAQLEHPGTEARREAATSLPATWTTSISTSRCTASRTSRRQRRTRCPMPRSRTAGR
jgi:hypothetical protein